MSATNSLPENTLASKPAKKVFDLHAAEGILGYTPVNRHDRRKAEKLLRAEKH